MRIGIDFGGTKTEIICLDKSNGKELYRHRVPTTRDDYAATVKLLQGLVQQAEQTLGQTGTLGVGIPGTIVPETGLIKNANSQWINNKPFEKDVGAALNRPVRMENDANCFAVSEATDGAAAGKKVVFGVIIGTGCGGGLALDGRAHRGINCIGGEWGHNPLPYMRVFGDSQSMIKHFGGHNVPDLMADHYDADLSNVEHPGELCYCGRRGCIETWISGTGFKNDYARVTGKALSTHDIIAAAEKGEAKAVAALDRYISRLARSLAQMTNILDPDVIVLGGGMSNVQKLYEATPKLWTKYIFSDTVKTQIVQAQHGDSSGVRGAAWLWAKSE